MALLGINAHVSKEKRETWEKILDAALSAAQITGAGVDIVNSIKTQKLNTRKQNVDELTTFDPSTQGQEGAVQFPGPSAFGKDAFVKEQAKEGNPLNILNYDQKKKDMAPPNEATIKIYKKIHPNMPVPDNQKDTQDMINYAVQKSTQAPGSVTEKERFDKPDQFQWQSAGFAMKMEQTLPVLEKYEGIAAESGARFQKAAGKMGLGEAVSPEYKLFENAKRSFINSQLRRESGSSIRDEEFISAENQYFPVSGDTPEVLAQKREMRKAAYANMRASAGDIAFTKSKTELENLSKPQESSKKGDVDGDGQISTAEKWMMNNPDDPRVPDMIKALRLKKGM